MVLVIPQSNILFIYTMKSMNTKYILWVLLDIVK